MDARQRCYSVQRLYIAGELVEAWINPEAPFSTEVDDIRQYAKDNRLVDLFNALILRYQEENDVALSVQDS